MTVEDDVFSLTVGEGREFFLSLGGGSGIKAAFEDGDKFAVLFLNGRVNINCLFLIFS